MSLFDNQELNQVANLVVNAKDIFSKYEPEDNRYGEINSGTWYTNAYHNCIKDPDKDFLCPIVLASDKTTLSEMGDLHVDAIFMTTSVFDFKASTIFISHLNKRILLTNYTDKEQGYSMARHCICTSRKKLLLCS